MPSFSAPLVAPGLVAALDRPVDCTVPVRFDDADDAGRGRAFSLPAARSTPVRLHGAGWSFVGDVRAGGSCNCETHTLTPHGTGTHTEGVGHLLADRVAVLDLVDDALVPALLVTVAPARLGDTDDVVSGTHNSDDRVIDELSLREAWERALPTWMSSSSSRPPRALVVRTAPGEQRRTERFSGNNPPYLTVDAALWLREQGVAHLVVDLPSVDREDDGGLLGAHRAFFDLGPQQRHLEGRPPPRRTITELAAVPSSAPDGGYALGLQLAPIVADAVPSRVLLYPLFPAPLSWKAGAA